MKKARSSSVVSRAFREKGSVTVQKLANSELTMQKPQKVSLYPQQQQDSKDPMGNGNMFRTVLLA